MINRTNQSLTFDCLFIANKQGKTGLTVTVDVYNAAGTQVVTGGSATAVGGGIYTYTLASGSVTATGNFRAIFKTSDSTVDQQHLAALQIVSEWADAQISSRASATDYTTARAAKLDFLDAAISTRATVAGIWDALLTGITTAGSIGKLIKDYLDAAISTRLATSGYTTPPTATAIRSEIDTNSTKLDATVSSRLATSGYTAPANSDVAAIKAKTDLLTFTGTDVKATLDGETVSLAGGGASVEVIGPVVSGGNIEIIRGDSYLVSDGRALTWTLTGMPSVSLSGTTTKFKARNGTKLFTKTVTTASLVGSTLTVTLELHTSETEGLPIGEYAFDISTSFASGTEDITWLSGTMTVERDVR